MADPVFVRRCRVCEKEITTEWGPETHSLSEIALYEHLQTHTKDELFWYAVVSHLGVYVPAKQLGTSEGTMGS